MVSATDYYGPYTEYKALTYGDLSGLADLPDIDMDQDGILSMAQARELVEWMKVDQCAAYGCPVLGHNQASPTIWAIYTV
jgi:hypothetical protein